MFLGLSWPGDFWKTSAWCAKSWVKSRYSAWPSALFSTTLCSAFLSASSWWIGIGRKQWWADKHLQDSQNSWQKTRPKKMDMNRISDTWMISVWVWLTVSYSPLIKKWFRNPDPEHPWPWQRRTKSRRTFGLAFQRCPRRGWRPVSPTAPVDTSFEHLRLHRHRAPVSKETDQCREMEKNMEHDMYMMVS